MQLPRDAVYDAWVERNTYATTLLYSGFIAVLLPAFHYVLQTVRVPQDSLPLRLVCTACAAAVAATLLLFPRARRFAECFQFLQILVTVFVIDVLVVDSNDQYLYIASALLIIIGVQNAYFRTSILAITMSAGWVFFIAYSGARGILFAPYNLTTLAIFFTGYALAFIPASMHIRSRQSDIRSRLQAMRATSELEEAHAITHLGKWSQNLQTGEVHCSAELLRILGLAADTPHAALPELYARSIHPDDRTLVNDALRNCDAAGDFSIDHRILSGGSARWVQLSGKQEFDEDGTPVHRLGTVMDVTARKEAEVSLERLARYDPLTGLPNRAMLHDELRDALRRHDRSGARCAVLFLDLDRFKDINDTLGHSVGDLLLKELATRISSVLPGALVARWGGDEFVAVLGGIEDEASVERTCRRVIHGLSAPFVVESYEFAVMASIGAALFPNDGSDPEVLIRNADTAMYAAKEARGQHYAFFAPQMHAVAARRHRIQNQLQSAVASGSLVLHYQPIVESRTSRLIGAEALLRWSDAEGRLHPPEDFISVAEDTGAIVPIGKWVVERAAEQALRWQRAGMPISVAINLSPRQARASGFYRHALAGRARERR